MGHEGTYSRVPHPPSGGVCFSNPVGMMLTNRVAFVVPIERGAQHSVG
jgi:hypothetical protein